MGLFDLPTRKLELKIDDEWKSVMLTDNLLDTELNSCTDMWRKQGHKVTGARYDGRVIYDDEEPAFVVFQSDPFPKRHVPLAPTSDAHWMTCTPPDES